MPKKPQRSSSHRKSSVKSASKSAKSKRTHGRPHSPEADEVRPSPPASAPNSAPASASNSARPSPSNSALPSAANSPSISRSSSPARSHDSAVDSNGAASPAYSDFDEASNSAPTTPLKRLLSEQSPTRGEEPHGNSTSLASPAPVATTRRGINDSPHSDDCQYMGTTSAPSTVSQSRDQDNGDALSARERERSKHSLLRASSPAAQQQSRDEQLYILKYLNGNTRIYVNVRCFSMIINDFWFNNCQSLKGWKVIRPIC
jgi:hypothetical protein